MVLNGTRRVRNGLGHVPRAPRRGSAGLGRLLARSLSQLEIDGIGRALFCHATPTADDPIYTRSTPDDDLAALLGDVEAELLVVGHTHVQFDRRLPDGRRVVNAGSVGIPFERPPGAYWALLGPGVELRRTDYDVEAAVSAMRSAGARSTTNTSTSCSNRPTGTRRPHVSRPPAVARSYVHEARRRGLGRRRERIGPIIERLAEEHADAEIALRFRSDLELLVSVMLSAQTTDTNVNRVTERLFEKYRKPEDYLAVPQEELERDIYATGFFRQKAKAIRGTMHVLLEEFDGVVPGTLEELMRLPGVARKTANVVASELGHAQGIVVDTHVRRLSQRLGLTRQEDPGEDRARPPEDRAARGLAALPAPADLARPPGLRRASAALRGLCDRGPLPVEPARGGRRRRRQIQRRQRKSASWTIVDETMSALETPIDQYGSSNAEAKFWP